MDDADVKGDDEGDEAPKRLGKYGIGARGGDEGEKGEETGESGEER